MTVCHVHVYCFCDACQSVGDVALERRIAVTADNMTVVNCILEDRRTTVHQNATQLCLTVGSIILTTTIRLYYYYHHYYCCCCCLLLDRL